MKTISKYEAYAIKALRTMGVREDLAGFDYTVEAVRLSASSRADCFRLRFRSRACSQQSQHSGYGQFMHWSMRSCGSCWLSSTAPFKNRPVSPQCSCRRLSAAASTVSHGALALPRLRINAPTLIVPCIAYMMF
jgi:hypothetical protein